MVALASVCLHIDCFLFWLRGPNAIICYAVDSDFHVDSRRVHSQELLEGWLGQESTGSQIWVMQVEDTVTIQRPSNGLLEVFVRWSGSDS